MKGKRKFTEEEARNIRELISKKVGASRAKQIRIRKKIRDFKFYFTDFSNKKGYTVSDFDNLITSGKIVIEKKSSQVSFNEKDQSREKSKAIDQVERELLNEDKFVSIRNLEQNILNTPGFYCIKLKPGSLLPQRYQSILDQREFKIIYLGIAKKSLRERLYAELELKSPGTFFRSIGCVLEYLPIKGHLYNKKNKYNFKYHPNDRMEIADWLRNNAEVSVATYNGNFNIECELILKYCPLLNYTHNPLKLKILEDDKKKCRQYAREL